MLSVNKGKCWWSLVIDEMFMICIQLWKFKIRLLFKQMIMDKVEV